MTYVVVPRDLVWVRRLVLGSPAPPVEWSLLVAANQQRQNEAKIMPDLPTQVTALLRAMGDGDAGAADQLIRVVYGELHRVAHGLMAREDRRGDLQTTVVVHGVCLRLLRGGAEILPQSRRQLFGFAAKSMRQFLIDDARKRSRLKRGGGRPACEVQSGTALGEAAAVFGHDPAVTLAVHEALENLARRDTEMARVVELRFYGGLTIDETAEVMGVSPRYVDKKWAFAAAWLQRALS